MNSPFIHYSHHQQHPFIDTNTNVIIIVIIIIIGAGCWSHLARLRPFPSPEQMCADPVPTLTVCLCVLLVSVLFFHFDLVPHFDSTELLFPVGVFVCVASVLWNFYISNCRSYHRINLSSNCSLCIGHWLLCKIHTHARNKFSIFQTWIVNSRRCECSCLLCMRPCYHILAISAIFTVFRFYPLMAFSHFLSTPQFAFRGHLWSCEPDCIDAQYAHCLGAIYCAAVLVSFSGHGNNIVVGARTEPISLSTLDRDCFIIPVHSLDRFLPAGIPVSIIAKNPLKIMPTTKAPMSTLSFFCAM